MRVGRIAVFRQRLIGFPGRHEELSAFFAGRSFLQLPVQHAFATGFVARGRAACTTAATRAPEARPPVPEVVEPSLVAPPDSLWTRFVRWSYTQLGGYVYPSKADICNCGIDMGMVIPRPELVTRQDIQSGSTEWRMQIYGAALYWHLATTPQEKASEIDTDMLRGKDVLEVGCMRGGGARYLAEVAGPRSYVATDNVEEHMRIDEALPTNLRFERAEALTLDISHPAESFDFVLCVQSAASFSDSRAFIRGAKHVLRPGGRLLFCDAMSRPTLQKFLEAIEDEGMILDACSDLSRAVHAVGLCSIPKGVSYLRVVARKEEVIWSYVDRDSAS